MAYVPLAPDPGSAKWWLQRLDQELDRRLGPMQVWRELVDDEHEAPESDEKAAKFARIAGLATTNLTGLAIEATAERMAVEGLRVGNEPDADRDVWDDLWQRSNFDAGSQEAITSALVYGRSFVSVEPPSGGSEFSTLHYEDPRQVIVAHGPRGERRAALKVFPDEWTGDVFATLYLPDVIVKMVRKNEGPATMAGPRWLAREVGRNDPVIRNPLGEVPFFELRNLLTGSQRSEVAPLEIPQRRLNQVVFNTDSVAEAGAFRQKWGTNIEVPRDADGKPINPYEAGVTKMFIASASGEGAKDPRFGDFNATDLEPYVRLGQDVAAHIARLSRVPITYFLSNVANLSADALALLISGLVRKCERRVKGYEPAFEDAVRLALRAQSDPRALTANIELKWADMETRSRAQDADAAVKLTQGDNPVITPQTAQEKYLGMTQTERDRDAAWRDRTAGRARLEAVAAAAAGARQNPAVAGLIGRRGNAG